MQRRMDGDSRRNIAMQARFRFQGHPLPRPRIALCDGRQRPPAEESKETEAQSARTPGRPIDWVFNLKATVGAFGFSNSLYTNPRPDEPSGDLSDNWLEASIKPAIGGTLDDRKHRTDLWEVERGRRAHLRCCRPRWWAAMLLVRGRGLVPRLALREQPRRSRRKRARFHSRPRPIQARPRPVALGRLGRWRFAGGLLDRRAQRIRVRRDRPVQTRRTHAGGVLSREGRTARIGYGQRALGCELPVRNRRRHDARRNLHGWTADPDEAPQRDGSMSTTCEPILRRSRT